jgi:hypothetical protein
MSMFRLEKNSNRVQRDNVFGKASRSRVDDILAIFRQRYLDGIPEQIGSLA